MLILTIKNKNHPFEEIKFIKRCYGNEVKFKNRKWPLIERLVAKGA